MAGERSIIRVWTDRMILLLWGVIALELLGLSRTPLVEGARHASVLKTAGGDSDHHPRHGNGGAGSVQAHDKNTVTAVNKISADINQSLNIEYRFRPGTLHIKHGATLTFRQGPPQPPSVFPDGVEPHTLSIVRRADLPRTLQELFECEVCGPFLEAHDAFGESPTFIVNEGRAGLNRPGDSLLITNDHPVTTAPVTAPAGTTLHYLCAVHSWMQGKLVVGSVIVTPGAPRCTEGR